jgi:hypothetical protein
MDAKEAISGIQELAAMNGLYYADEKSLAKLCVSSLLSLSCGNTIWIEKTLEVERCMNILASPRKIHKQPGGVEQVRAWIAGALTWIEDALADRKSPISLKTAVQVAIVGELRQ